MFGSRKGSSGFGLRYCWVFRELLSGSVVLQLKPQRKPKPHVVILLLDPSFVGNCSEPVVYGWDFEGLALGLLDKADCKVCKA